MASTLTLESVFSRSSCFRLVPSLTCYPSVSSPALLTLVLDLSPLAWHDASSTTSPEVPSENLTLKAMLVQVLIFMNAHLAATAGNRLAVWGVKGRKRSVSSPALASSEDRG